MNTQLRYLKIFIQFVFIGFIVFTYHHLRQLGYEQAPHIVNTRSNTPDLDDTIDLSIITVNYALLNVRKGQEIRYTLYYQNTGDQTATEVIVQQNVPNYATYDPDATNLLATAPPWTYTSVETGSILTADIGILYPGERGRLEFIAVMDDLLPILAPVVSSQATIQSLSFDYPDHNLQNNRSLQEIPIGTATINGLLWADEDGDGSQGLTETVSLADIVLDVGFAHAHVNVPGESILITSTQDGIFMLNDVIFDDFFINCNDVRCPFSTLFVRTDEVSGFTLPFNTKQEAALFKERLSGQSKRTVTQQLPPSIWFVRFLPNTPEEQRIQLLTSVGRMVDWWPQIDVALLEPDTQRFDPAALEAHAAVEFVEPDSQITGIEDPFSATIGLPSTPNFSFTEPQSIDNPSGLQENLTPDEDAARFVPNDPDLNDNSLTYSAEIIQVFDAWGITTGSNEVVVAIIDTGLITNHLDIEASRVLPGYDFVREDAIPDDENGHGTHITGIIAATINNNIGTSGVCPQCKLLPVKVLDQHNTGSWSNISEGVLYAVDQGAKILNLSLGGQFPPRVFEQAVAYAVRNDVLMIAAGGNTGTETTIFPAAYEAVMGVSATDQTDQLWLLSSTGNHIEISAPGHSIYSTWGNSTINAAGFKFLSGTSMAAPHVSGIAGLLLSQESTLTAADLRQLIIDSSIDLGSPDRDIEFGYGRVNAVKALQLLVDQNVFLPVIRR